MKYPCLDCKDRKPELMDLALDNAHFHRRKSGDNRRTRR